jgi:hypothetical protein
LTYISVKIKVTCFAITAKMVTDALFASPQKLRGAMTKLIQSVHNFAYRKEVYMPKIIFTMDSGERFTLSNEVYAGKGPINTAKDASIQLSLIMEKLMYFSADDGTLVMTKHVASARIEE